eukprot:gene57000-biopygen114652
MSSGFHLDQYINVFMELVAGGSLARLVSTMDDVLAEHQGIVNGVAYLHEAGIIHRDIKGDNVLISLADGHCKISDFGSSKSSTATAVGATLAGTPNWM